MSESLVEKIVMFAVVTVVSRRTNNNAPNPDDNDASRKQVKEKEKPTFGKTFL